MRWSFDYGERRVEPRRPTRLFQISFTDGHVVFLDADDVFVRGAFLLAVRYVVVVLSPREVVVARLRRADVVSVVEL